MFASKDDALDSQIPRIIKSSDKNNIEKLIDNFSGTGNRVKF